MNLFAKTKIATKIISLLALLGVLTIAIGWMGSHALRQADKSYSALITDLTSSIKMAQVNRRIAVMTGMAYQTMAFDGASAQAKAADVAERDAYDSSLVRLATVEKASPQVSAKIAEFRTGIGALHILTRQSIVEGLANRNDEARKTLAKVDALAAPLSKALVAFNEAQIANADNARDSLVDSAAATAWTLMILSIVGAILGMAVGVLVSRVGITTPLNALRQTMARLASGDNRVEVPGVGRGDEVGAMAQTVLVFRDAAVALEAAAAAKRESDAQQQQVVEIVSSSLASLSDGDLTAEIDRAFPEAFEALKRNFNTALTNLRDLISGVTQSADGIRSGSAEIAQASEDLARRTESNAASLEETSAALAQIDGRLRATAASSTQTVVRADQAITTVDGGRATAVEAVAAMGRVSDSAKGIDSVIEGLDKIAFQTRVLAMNAAVEAGRAGDAGRGFAVVADLVSALAMRAEEEAKRARNQLTVTQAEIGTAVQAVQKVDGALANISGDVGEVHKLLGTMAEDAAAQSSAITQISAAIGAMDQSTQQNAAMVEETSAAARNLTAEVTALSEQTGMFQTEGAARARRAPAGRLDPTLTAPDIRPKRPAPVRHSPAKLRSTMAAAGGELADWNAF